MSTEKDRRFWIVNGFQIGIPLGIYAGIIPVYFARGWNNVWLPFLAISVWLLIPLAAVSGYRRDRGSFKSVWKEREVYSLLLGVGAGATVAASAILIEFFAVRGALVTGAIILLGLRIAQWLKLWR